MSPFEQSTRLAASNVLLAVNRKCYEIAWELFSSVVRKTPSPDNPGPKAKGLLANQWYPQEQGASAARGTSKSRDGSSSLARIQAMMNGTVFYDKDGKFTLTNNMDYVEQAESAGWKRTPPYRMVALSLQATAAKYKKVNI